MSKFTKYLMRAADCAKPEKEAGLVSGITKEGFLMCKIVGNPKASAQVLLHAAELDLGMKEFLSYLCEEFNRIQQEIADELQDEQEGSGEDRQSPEEECSLPSE